MIETALAAGHCKAWLAKEQQREAERRDGNYEQVRALLSPVSIGRQPAVTAGVNQPKLLAMPTWLPFLGVLLVFELAGDVVAKEFALHGGAWRMTLAASLVVVGNISWQLMLRNGMELGRGGLLFAVGVAVGVLLIGTVVYDETLTMRQLAGATFGLIAIALLAF